jgi:hypothetical protein
LNLRCDQLTFSSSRVDKNAELCKAMPMDIIPQ